jgi:hypothetical protein
MTFTSNTRFLRRDRPARKSLQPAEIWALRRRFDGAVPAAPSDKSNEMNDLPQKAALTRKIPVFVIDYHGLRTLRPRAETPLRPQPPNVRTPFRPPFCVAWAQQG